MIVRSFCAAAVAILAGCAATPAGASLVLLENERVSLAGNEFYWNKFRAAGTVAVDFKVALDSGGLFDTCVMTETELDAWRNGQRAVGYGCVDRAGYASDNVTLQGGEYALVIRCLDPCSVRVSLRLFSYASA